MYLHIYLSKIYLYFQRYLETTKSTLPVSVTSRSQGISLSCDLQSDVRMFILPVTFSGLGVYPECGHLR